MKTTTISPLFRIIPIATTLILFALAGSLWGADIVRVSVSTDGKEANNACRMPRISADGRFVVFESSATTLVPDDTNYRQDIFVHDLQTGTTERVSVPDGREGEANSSSANASISADGRYVVFESTATNLVPGLEKRDTRIFIHDRTTGTTELASVNTYGEPAGGAHTPVISGDGRYVVFNTRQALDPADSNNADDIYLRDRIEQTTERVSITTEGFEANWASIAPSISADGRWIAFESRATDMVVDDYNDECDIFVRDRQRGETRRISVSSLGEQSNGRSGAPAISADGRYVVYQSAASNLVEGDWNGYTDVFMHDLETGETRCVSQSFDQGSADADSTAPAVSADGQYVTFMSQATNLNAFWSDNTNQIYHRDMVTGETNLASVPSAGSAAGGKINNPPAISGDGMQVVFQSTGYGLVTGDTNKMSDIFVANMAN